MLNNVIVKVESKAPGGQVKIARFRTYKKTRAPLYRLAGLNGILINNTAVVDTGRREVAFCMHKRDHNWSFSII
jgi:hypothetical protein